MARIRTIKPEFWRHPVMARQPDDVRLMAIALLNVADDEGYFYADPALLRGEVWPFDEDSSRTRRVLEHLSKVGWIEVYEHPEIGFVGIVVNFSKHQKVDRPGPSKIKGYRTSTNARRMFVESSLLEQGTGNREQGSVPNGTLVGSDPADDSGKDGIPPCPHQTIIDLFGELLPELPQPRSWEGQRPKNLRARWRWVLTATRPRTRERYATDTATGIDFFRRMFAYVRESDFLMGRDGGWGGCDLGWLVKAENFEKVIAGNYANKETA